MSAATEIAKPIRRKLSVRTPVGKRSNQYVTVIHKVDPRQAILDKIGPIPEGVVMFNRILVAIYQPPLVEKTDGGLFLTNTISDDDREEFTWQGKAALLVAMGPQAYVDDENTKFYGAAVKVGDWVWSRPSDGLSCEINEVPCRVLTERDIVGVLPHPDMVW